MTPSLHSLFWQARNPSQSVDGYVVRIWQKRIYLGGTIRTQDEAEELIATISALKTMLPARSHLHNVDAESREGNYAS